MKYTEKTSKNNMKPNKILNIKNIKYSYTNDNKI